MDPMYLIALTSSVFCKCRAQRCQRSCVPCSLRSALGSVSQPQGLEHRRPPPLSLGHVRLHTFIYVPLRCVRSPGCAALVLDPIICVLFKGITTLPTNTNIHGLTSDQSSYMINSNRSHLIGFTGHSSWKAGAVQPAPLPASSTSSSPGRCPAANATASSHTSLDSLR